MFRLVLVPSTHSPAMKFLCSMMVPLALARTIAREGPAASGSDAQPDRNAVPRKRTLRIAVSRLSSAASRDP